jgi:opacity protein-like surface antigen
MNTFSVESEYYTSLTSTAKQIVNATYSSYALTTGTQTQIASNITLGTEWGFIVYFDKYKDVKSSYEDFNTGQPVVQSKTLRSGNAIFFADISLGFLF